MAIENMPGGGTIITGSDIPVFALMSLASALAIEMTTGMRASRIPALQAAKNLGVIPKDKRGNKKDALVKTIAKIQESRPEYVPTSSVQKALDS